MLEYGSVTGLPDKYRITLAISIALLAHTLIVASLPFTAQNVENHRQTVKVELINSGSVPLPESAATNAKAPAPFIGDQSKTVTAKSSRNEVQPSREKERTPSSTPAPPSTVETPKSQVRSPNSVAPAAGSPEQPAEKVPEMITRITPSPRDADPYIASLATHIGKELGKHPVPSSRSVTEPVTSQLEIRLLPSGALTGAAVIDSTGFNDIDRAIYQAALLASPYPKPPEEYSGRKQFRVELIFTPERL